MKRFDTCDDFYALPETRRIEWVGKMFGSRQPSHRKALFFPVTLAPGEFNYGYQQGLIFISPIHVTLTGKKRHKWFRVGVISPDDLDIDLDFRGNEVQHRQAVIDFVIAANKHNVRYRAFIAAIRAQFGVGGVTPRVPNRE